RTFELRQLEPHFTGKFSRVSRPKRHPNGRISAGSPLIHLLAQHFAYSPSSAFMDILLAAAFHPELAALRPILGDKMVGTIGAVEVAAKAVGIGLAASAVGTAA